MRNYLLRCHDNIWFALHVTILNIPPTRLFIFPSLAGTVWFITLASLLMTWIFARDMRPYPGQGSPRVPFISDIASFELKPLFLVGASITAMGFLFTVAAVHVMRYEPGFALIRQVSRGESSTSYNSSDARANDDQGCGEEDGEEEEEEEEEATLKSLKLISLVSIFFAGIASASLTMLSVMDTFRYTSAHHIFVRLCFAGLAVQSAGTAIVYADEVLSVVMNLAHVDKWKHGTSGRRARGAVKGRRGVRVRFSATLSSALILIELFLGVAFLSLSVTGDKNQLRAAGILEWIIAFLGTVYLWLFVGFFDRDTFEGYVPRILYETIEPANGAVVVGESSGTRGRVERESRGGGGGDDPEHAPLLVDRAHSARKYT
ncbi:Frag1/DRAM/Sfk1 family-domain-containing protein [Aspergillus egyptiacus]|nr:Frag1/DRAM/Sfk1 family-domain-containing protein [Aspergillus egyptiacus]